MRAYVYLALSHSLFAETLALALEDRNFDCRRVTETPSTWTQGTAKVLLLVHASHEQANQLIASAHRSRVPSIVLFALGTNVQVTVRCIESGATRTVAEGADFKELFGTLDHVLGESQHSPASIDTMLAATGNAVPKQTDVGECGLTDEEQRVATLLRQGLSNKAIAQELEISPYRVKNLVHIVVEKSPPPDRQHACSSPRPSQPLI